ncbi:MAG: hypothetical protein DWI24_11305, partial [Planctomycetota bacterium]
SAAEAVDKPTTTNIIEKTSFLIIKVSPCCYNGRQKNLSIDRDHVASQSKPIEYDSGPEPLPR